MKPKHKIIFIISDGHSGSTLLDLLLGTLPGIMSTGELIWLPWQTFRDGKMCTATPKQDICTCLRTFRECDVWGNVLQNLSKKIGYDVKYNPLSFDVSFFWEKKYSSYKKSLKYILIRRILKYAILLQQNWLINIINNSRKLQIDNTLILYDSIAQTTHLDYISDSSKDIFRAYAIWRRRPESVKIILLYKDAKSYASSGKHWKSKTPVKLRLKKWIHHYKNKYIPILKRMPGCEILTIKYDEIARNPDNARKSLANFLGIHCEKGSWQINTKNMHIVAGNPMRYGGKINIRYDDRWKTELNSKEIKMAENYEKRMQELIQSGDKNWQSFIRSA
jgi:hypothetical protein